MTGPASAMLLNGARFEGRHSARGPACRASTLPPMFANAYPAGEGGKFGAPSPRVGVDRAFCTDQTVRKFCMTKTCTRCGEAKPHTEEFFYRKNAAGKLGSSCRPCESARVLARYHERTEVQAASRARSKAWAAANRERMRELHKRWRAENREKERVRLRAVRVAMMAQPASRLRMGMRQRLAYLRKSSGLHPGVTVDIAVGCSWDAYVDHIERGWAEGMSWENYGSWHIDHIKPVGGADLTNLEAALAVFHFTNVRPLWAHENQRKGKR